MLEVSVDSVKPASDIYFVFSKEEKYSTPMKNLGRQGANRKCNDAEKHDAKLQTMGFIIPSMHLCILNVSASKQKF
jgi:hypothetical protein